MKSASCKTPNNEATAAIRSHCWKSCCACKKNKCKNIPYPWFSAKKTSWNSLYEVILGIAEYINGEFLERIDFDVSKLQSMTEEELGEYLENLMVDYGYDLNNLDDDLDDEVDDLD